MSTTTPPQITVGDTLEPITVHFDRARLVRYAGAGGDFNPIHWDEQTAKGVGLPDVIAHGMLTMGAAVEVVAGWIGDTARIVDYGVRFSAMVPVPHDEGADVIFGGKVLKVDEEAGTAVIDLSATLGESKVLSRARVTVALS